MSRAPEELRLRVALGAVQGCRVRASRPVWPLCLRLPAHGDPGTLPVHGDRSRDANTVVFRRMGAFVGVALSELPA
ncbi:Hypothetical predicted protein, partial [Lynx pardinus]